MYKLVFIYDLSVMAVCDLCSKFLFHLLSDNLVISLVTL